jgi:serine/threonine-protein kinase
MALGSRSRVPIALGSATTDTEEGRAFLQERLGLYAWWIFVLSGGFYLLNIGLSHDVRVQLGLPSLAHLGASLAMGAVWVASRTMTIGATSLRWLDSAGLIVVCWLFVLMGYAMGRMHVAVAVDPITALFVGQLACSSTILARAVAVPSTPTRTLWLGVAALAPQPVLGASLLFRAPVLTAMPGHGPNLFEIALSDTLHLVGWCGVAIAVSTVGSRVIFGLRAEAAKVRRLGQYVLEEKIGEGGMGIVYRARHAMLRRPTAIKLLPPERAGEENIGRFEREVQLTATLSHPSTVAIFDYGRTPTGLFYYAMEYLHGLNLDELVRKDGPQLPSRVIHILEQVSGALTEAHEAGLIHRDIKPANIILCERGGMPDVAKVVDFGLVKRVATLDSDDATMMETTRHVLTGTPLYMAPEAVRGEQSVDGRSDLYALGAVGYFLLTGAPVFEAASLVEVVAHHLHTPPRRPSERSPHAVPADLEAVVLRCLAKDPDARFATARDLARALHECARRTPWSIEDAYRWWESFARGPVERRPDTSSGDLPTLAIDLDERSRLAPADQAPVG